MGFSGLAFRSRWSKWNLKKEADWCPSASIGEMPEEFNLLRKTAGWELIEDVEFNPDKMDLESIKNKIVKSIKANKPVTAYTHCLDISVIFGTKDFGNKLLVWDYQYGNKVLEWPIEKIGLMQVYLGRKVDSNGLDVFKNSIKTGIKNPA